MSNTVFVVVHADTIPGEFYKGQPTNDPYREAHAVYANRASAEWARSELHVTTSYEYDIQELSNAEAKALIERWES